MGYNSDVGSINTGAPTVLASFQGITGASVAAAQTAFILLCGWSSDSTNGARISGISDNQGNTWVEDGTRRKANGFSLAHTVSLWRASNTAGGSAITATLTPVDGSAISIWDGVIFTWGGLDASPLEQAVVVGDQSPTQTSIVTGSITTSFANCVLLSIGMSIADSFGTITEDAGAGWTSLGSSTTAEGFGAVYQDFSSTVTRTHTWSLGYTSQYGPISLMASYKYAGGGGGGGNPWYSYAQQRQRVERLWKKRGLLWEPSYALRAA
jgi:hypothetical protein